MGYGDLEADFIRCPIPGQFFFGWGKGVKCDMHHSALRHRVWDSSKVAPTFARLDGMPCHLRQPHLDPLEEYGSLYV